MKEKFYPFKASEDYLFYYFESRSEERTIPKAVQFEKIGTDIYNLAFGDLGSDDDINDVVVSNNGDMHKVMATVVQIIIAFFGAYPGKQIYFTGSTRSRIRLYRAILVREVERWSELFEVKGVLRGKPVALQNCVNYEAFLISRFDKIYETKSEEGGHF